MRRREIKLKNVFKCEVKTTKNMPKCEYVNISRREDENLRKCFFNLIKT